MPKITHLTNAEVFVVRDVEAFDVFLRFAGENEGDPATVLNLNARATILSTDAIEALEGRIAKLELIHN